MNNNEIRDTDTITIAGAGLAGSLLAIYLAKQGFKVEVFERWGDPRSDEAPAGRSINLALAERGIFALQQVGLHHRIGQMAIPMRGRMVHQQGAEPALQPYGANAAEVIYSVHRSKLNQAMLDAAEQTERVRIHFNQELLSADLESGQATFLDHASDRQYTRETIPLIGADGAGSPTRAALEKFRGFESRLEMLGHSYKELSIPAAADGGFQMHQNSLHIWPRGGFMMIALPNSDGSFTNTLFLPNEGPDSFSTLTSKQAVRDFFSRHFDSAIPLLQNLDQEFEENPIGTLATLRCPHWQHKGRVVLVGDAAHAVVPFHGQGMNCAFEDCFDLDRCIAESSTWPEAFERFELARKANGNAIADMAIENYVEMRSDVADPGFQLRRALGKELEKRFPERFVPRYSMVMFRRIPYAMAQSRGLANSSILRELTKGKNSLEQVNFEHAAELIEQRLEPISNGDGPIQIIQ
jgi:kynurenine 3-monooxygenase